MGASKRRDSPASSVDYDDEDDDLRTVFRANQQQ